MRYLSTRGGVAPLSFSRAVMMGLASDGGLLLPESIPKVERETLAHWAKLPYNELAFEVLSLYTGDDIQSADLRQLVDRSYAGFSHPEITPVVEVGALRVLELFHGPTLAFKDVALQLLGNLFAYLLERDGGHLNIVGATSGDTGSAAIYGVRGKPGIDIYILHPKGKVSPVQERQMTSVLDANVHNVAIEGTFDDAQGIVKSLFGDLGFKERYRLGAVNSINWARIAAQIVYYFYAWGRLTGGDCDKKLRFAVPTGNFGDIFAGHVARMMGLPVDELIIATNQNDILDRFVRNADYSSGAVHSTITPAMDIQVSSNFERYLYYLVGQESQRVAQLMAEFAATGRLTVTPEEHQRVVADFTSHAVDQETTLATIARYHRDYAYTLDPHTAVGVAAAERSGGDAIVCLATAHPAKFGEAVVSATGCEPQLPPVYADLMERETRLVTLPATAQAVRQLIEEQARTS